MTPPGGLWECKRTNKCERKSKPKKPSLHHPSTTFLKIPLKPKVGTDPWKLSRVKSIELRSGNLHKSCECYKHNGLQDDCKRTICMENPRCSNYSKQLCELGTTMSIPRTPKVEQKYDKFHLKIIDDRWEINEPQQFHFHNCGHLKEREDADDSQCKHCKCINFHVTIKPID